MNNRYLFIEAEEGRVDVIGLDEQPICWIPTAAAEALQGVYKTKCDVDFVFANEWFAGVLFGIHHALAFSNQMPEIEHFVTKSGLSTYRMVDPNDRS